jgi:hypothetical protein
MSTMPQDRIKEPMAAFVRGVLPQIDFLALYPGTVVNQRGPNAFDFVADDARIGTFSGIPMLLPFPGFSLTLNDGEQPRCLVGFDGGLANAPRLQLWEAIGLKAFGIQAESEIDLLAPLVKVGASGASPDFVATAQRVLTQLQAMATVFANHTHVLALTMGTGTAAPPVTPMNPSAPASSTVEILG